MGFPPRPPNRGVKPLRQFPIPLPVPLRVAPTPARRGAVVPAGPRYARGPRARPRGMTGFATRRTAKWLAFWARSYPFGAIHGVRRARRQIHRAEKALWWRARDPR